MSPEVPLGLLPDTLLHEYVFWQTSGDDLRGYQKKDIQQQVQTPTMLEIKLLKVLRCGGRLTPLTR